MDELPVITPEMLRNAHTVCLTGGEPFLIPPRTLVNFCRHIREQYPNIQRLYIYTSGTGILQFSTSEFKVLFDYIDGLDIAPKTEREWRMFQRVNINIIPCIYTPKRRNKPISNRLYVFKEQLDSFFEIKDTINPSWNIISRTWDSTFNTPENEHFVRLPILF